MAKFETTMLLFLSSIEGTKNGDIYDVVLGRDGFDVISEKSNNKFRDEIKQIVAKKFQKGDRAVLSTTAGGIRIIPDDIYINFKKRSKTKKTSSGKKVPTAIQEAGSAFVMEQVLKNNAKFETPISIKQDQKTYKGLEKIFGSHKDKLDDWIHSYYEHQSAFFKEFQPSQWSIFEHGGEDFMTFIKKQAKNVKEKTVSGNFKDVGKYETWNPSDIWAVKDKDKVKKEIDDAIDDRGQTLDELNNVLLNLMNSTPTKLIGLSLKKIDPSETASFAYVNKDPKRVEFAKVEKTEMSDIKIEIKTEKTQDGMSQGAYVLFGKYTINIIRTPGENKFTNLKFESVIKGSGGRGGAAPVELVADLLKSKSPGYNISFVNKHQEYPQTSEDFYDDSRDYEKMYNSLRQYITGTSGYIEFRNRIIEMFDSDREKNRLVAQSKLMQLHFFSDALAKNSNSPEFWTDLLYLSLKVGKRFAPHGKLA